MADQRQHLAPGLIVDDFQLGERVFAGGMGSIWKATRVSADMATGEPADVPRDPPMVLKIPFIAAGEDVSAIVAYEVEEMIMKRLSGPHVPKFLGSGDLAKLPYIAMEFVSGESLEAICARAPLPAEDVARYGRQLARAVANLHRQHVIHFDLKPANVIVSPRGAVLIDFGLARHDELPDLLGEESSLPMGSAPYMSPEQILGDRSHPASDQFAIGAMLFELATGQPPFGVPRTRAGLKQRLESDPADLVAPLKDLPPGLAEVILRCMEVDPARRYPTADQLLFDLNHPSQVVPVKRTRRTKPGLVSRLKTWYFRDSQPQVKPRASVAQRLDNAPVIMAAVDLVNGADPLAEKVRMHARRALQAEPFARLACVTVLKTKLVGEDATHDAEGRPAYLGRLVQLKDWARSLQLPEESISYHVLEGVDVAALLLDYARHNRIDHIVMGARAASALRRHLGSVSARVVAEASCTVTVVRLTTGDLDADAVEAEIVEEEFTAPE